MNELYVKLRRNLGLSMILLIGLGVEFSNFQSMFYKFMLTYRADWGAFNHIPAIFLSAFLLLCIVIFGIRKQVGLSWFLALLTCVVSFTVYSRMNLAWNWEEMNEIHFVILILSGMLPLLVAYTTHQIAHDNEEEFDEMDEMMEQSKHSQRQAFRQRGQYVAAQHKGPARMARHAYSRPLPPQYEQSPRPRPMHTRHAKPHTDYYPSHEPQNEYYEQPHEQEWPNPQPRQQPKQQPPVKNSAEVAAPKPEPGSKVGKYGVGEVAQPALKRTPKIHYPMVEEEAAVQYNERREVVFPIQQPPVAKVEAEADDDAPKVPGGYLIACAHCGQERVKKTKTAKFCSEECRREAAKHKIGGFVAQPASVPQAKGHLQIVRDDYDLDGIMEWTV